MPDADHRKTNKKEKEVKVFFKFFIFSFSFSHGQLLQATTKDCVCVFHPPLSPSPPLTKLKRICVPLTFGRVFKATINDSTGQLRLEHEISEVAGVDTDVMSPIINILARGDIV